MIKAYDIVKSAKALGKRVPKGCKGTVVIVYPDFPTAFEVEFVDDNFETLEILTVSSDEIILAN